MHWQDIPHVMDDWTVKAAAPAYDLRRGTASVYTLTDVGYYYSPYLEKVAVYGPDNESDRRRCLASARRSLGSDCVRSSFLTYQELSDPDASWCKVAYSPGVRALGEATNFFPGQYPGGIPNSPSPVAAMLTSGLLGAGLGWGSGKILGKLLPQGYGDRLGRSGAILGSLLGIAPGLAWGGVNKMTGLPFNDPSLLGGKPGDEADITPSFVDGMNAAGPPDAAGQQFGSQVNDLAATGLLSPRRGMGKRGGARWQAAQEYMRKQADSFGHSDRRQETDLDVNINAVGQTLWQQGAPPNMAATTMSALYAAQQMPDPRSRPGVATGLQLGHLAGDYVRGALVGAAINAAIGTPFRASSFGLGNLALGVIGSVVPRLFGN